MKIGFIGLGRMGQGMVELLIEKGHQVVAYDINPESVQNTTKAGAIGVGSPQELVEQLDGPRLVWIMVQRSVVQDVLDELEPLLNEGDTVVDGGNTYFEETIRRSKAAEQNGIGYIDVGVSGGVSAARHGACLMVGGKKELFDRYEDVFKSLAQKDGYGYMGVSGAGHLVKGLHNGIEYGMMQAIGDGFEAIMSKKEQFKLQPKEILKVYNHGSIVESNLTKWLEKAWHEDDELETIAGTVPTGDTQHEMIELSRMSDNPSLELAIVERYESQKQPRFAGKVIAAMRNQFGGHKVNKADKNRVEHDEGQDQG